MKFKILILATCLALPVSAAEYITASVTFTNPPATGETITRNGSTARWTNGPANSTAWLQTNGPTGSATNLWRFLGANNPALYTRMTSPTNVTVSGAGLTLSADAYALVTLTTNVQTNNTIVTVPIANQSAANATNISSLLLKAINDHASNSFGTNITALANYLSLGPQVQRASNKVFEAIHITGSAVSNSTLVNIPSANVGTLIATSFTARAASITNGFITNSPAILTTNLQVVGGGYATNMDFNKVTATNVTVRDRLDISASGGVAALVLFNQTFALGQESSTLDFFLENVDSGQMLQRWENNGNTTLTSPTVVSNHLSVRTNFTANGLATFEAGVTETNVATFGTNKIAARVDFTPRANSSLADGNNSGIILGSNVYVRISGPSGAYTNAGFAAEQDGSFHILQFDNPANNMTILDNSGLDATAANRIRTGTGGNLNFTNNPVILRAIYDANASRWRLLDGAPYR